MTRHEFLQVQVAERADGECWRWPGAHGGTGYAHVRIGDRVHRVSRVAYSLRFGPIAEGLELDHLCQNKWCWNPAHLEPVTRSENVLRGDNPGGNSNKEFCKRGHPFDASNTRIDKDGKRICRACKRLVDRRLTESGWKAEWQRRDRQRKREARYAHIT